MSTLASLSREFAAGFLACLAAGALVGALLTVTGCSHLDCDTPTQLDLETGEYAFACDDRPADAAEVRPTLVVDREAGVATVTYTIDGTAVREEWRFVE